MSSVRDKAPETTHGPSDPKGAERKMMVITGATGQVGGEVLQRLVQQDVPVRALVRDPAKADSVRRSGAETVEGDFARPETLYRASKAQTRCSWPCPTRRPSPCSACWCSVRVSPRGSPSGSTSSWPASSPVSAHRASAPRLPPDVSPNRAADPRAGPARNRNFIRKPTAQNK